MATLRPELERRDTGDDRTRKQNGYYMITAQIGESFYNLILDTGSSDLWIRGNSAQRGGFSPSPATIQIGQHFNVSYGKPSLYASGYMVTEGIDVGDYVVQNMNMGVATELGDWADTVDGVLGMGFQSRNSVYPYQSPTFFEFINESLSVPIVTTTLEPEGEDGEVAFGFQGFTDYTQALSHAPVDPSTGTWLVHDLAITINGRSYEQSTVFGTGNTGPLLMNADAVKAYWDQVPYSLNLGANHPPPTFPCDSTLPDLAIEIGNGAAVIPGGALNLGPFSNSSTFCMGGLQTISIPGPSFMGGPFWETQHVRFRLSPLSIQYIKSPYSRW